LQKKDPCEAFRLAGRKELDYLQLSHEAEEQEAQAFDEDLMRLLPPPMPKEERSFWRFLLLQTGQETSFSPPIGTRVSNGFSQLLQRNS
jgi:hypothetical protein